MGSDVEEVDSEIDLGGGGEEGEEGEGLTPHASEPSLGEGRMGRLPRDTPSPRETGGPRGGASEDPGAGGTSAPGIGVGVGGRVGRAWGGGGEEEESELDYGDIIAYDDASEEGDDGDDGDDGSGEGLESDLPSALLGSDELSVASYASVSMEGSQGDIKAVSSEGSVF